MKELTLMDINDYIMDEQKVQIIAYNIPLFEGACGDIPVKYSKYPLVPQKTHVSNETLVIELDC